MENGGGEVVQPHVRGRGRPRASYAQTGELDLSLIREYRNRPSLYDRNSKRFKDKVFTAQQWQIISHKLGFDVSLLKDRMLQLRNRYNIEKRRVEQCNEENPDSKNESPWPLFSSLNFLSNHIRSRRSFKSFEKIESSQDADGGDDTYDTIGEEGLNSTAADQYDDDDDNDGGGGNEHMENNEEEQIDVKVELQASSSEDDYESNDPENELPVNTVPKIIIKNMHKGNATANTASSSRIVNGGERLQSSQYQNDLPLVKIPTAAAATSSSPATSTALSPNQKNSAKQQAQPTTISLRRIENMTTRSGTVSTYMPSTPQQQHLANFNLGSKKNISSMGDNNVSSPHNNNNSNNNKQQTSSMMNPAAAVAAAQHTFNSNNVNKNSYPPNLKRSYQQNGNVSGNNLSGQTTASPIINTAATASDDQPTINRKRTRYSSLRNSSGGGSACNKPYTGVGQNGNKDHLLAFGDFVGRTLCQMHPDVALRFIPKFTNELIESLLIQDNVDNGNDHSDYTNGGGVGGGCE